MAGMPQKPKSQLQNKRGGRGAQITVTPGKNQPAPPPPDGLLPGTRLVWADFWASAMAALVDRKAHLPACLRWIRAVDQVSRLQPLADATPLVTGSTGQVRANPLYGVIDGHTREIERFEDHFGGTLLAQMRLGIAIGEAAETLGGLMDDLNDPDDLEDDEAFSDYLGDPDAIEAEFSSP